MPDPELMTVRAAADLVGRKVKTVRSWMHNGKLPWASWRGRVRLVRRADVAALAARMDANAQSAGQRGRKCVGEPTLAELDALIAERYATRPAWFDREFRTQTEPRGLPVVLSRFLIRRSRKCR